MVETKSVDECENGGKSRLWNFRVVRLSEVLSAFHLNDILNVLFENLLYSDANVVFPILNYFLPPKHFVNFP